MQEEKDERQRYQSQRRHERPAQARVAQPVAHQQVDSDQTDSGQASGDGENVVALSPSDQEEAAYRQDKWERRQWQSERFT